ncbi:MAG: MgtC/SapB family protein [Planctomycetales bacterium]|nr:MgtC/SapB family protein [Planctomycetales bacterium]
MNPNEFDEFHEIVLRLGVAALLGAILGVDRDLHQKPAGVRVLAMVALGAALATLASITAIAKVDAALPDAVLRTVQGILSGIGFLGAGVIMQRTDQNEVHGITTAASIWVSAVVGITSGLGQWLVTATAFGLAMLILIGGRGVEQRLMKWSRPESDQSSP